tara:strand:+ start:1291 stop:1941 length:651 start_codon:yes stop_codon:yes gene_type:complete
LLARYVAIRGTIPLWSPRDSWSFLNSHDLPNLKTDINDGGPFSTDFIGFNWGYPEGDETTRRRILQNHDDYTQGLLYFIGHDPRVPQATRDEMLEWGYPKDEFEDNGHWTPQLYVREARRMVGSYVMTSRDLQTNRSKEDSIGIGSYGADSHLVQRIVDNGFVRVQADFLWNGSRKRRAQLPARIGERDYRFLISAPPIVTIHLRSTHEPSINPRS